MASADPRPLLTRRLRPTDLIILDVLAAVGLVLICGYAAADPPPSGVPDPYVREPVWLSMLLTLAVAAPVAVRRRWPVPVLAAVFPATLIALVVGVVPSYASPPLFVALAFALYPVALAEPVRRSGPALLLVLAGIAAVVVVHSPDWVETLVGFGFAGMLLAGTWTVGRAVRQRRAYAARSAEQLAHQAVTDERLRIARELHDIVAHSMSVITVKAAIANHVAQARPDEVREALRDIEATSRGALTEMRRTLGVLRAGATPGGPVGSGPAEFGPAPGFADLPALAGRATSAGVDLDLELTDGSGLPEDVGRSVYRIVQEALTNVVKHAAPARCRVTVAVHAGTVRVEVTDGGGRPARPPDPRGQGLIGMRERVSLYGGSFAAGPLPEGGFRVTAVLPYESAAGPAAAGDPAAASAPAPAPAPGAASGAVDVPAPAPGAASGAVDVPAPAPGATPGAADVPAPAPGAASGAVDVPAPAGSPGAGAR